MRNTKYIYVEAQRRGYRITTEGKILNPKGEFLQGGYIGHKTKGDLYLKFNIVINGKFKIAKVHVFQAYQKYGDVVFEENILVRHKDDNRENNSWDNILVGTIEDNFHDIPASKRASKSCKGHVVKGNRVLSDVEVDEIRLLALQGNLSNRQIARMYGSTSGNISNVVRKVSRNIKTGI